MCVCTCVCICVIVAPYCMATTNTVSSVQIGQPETFEIDRAGKGKVY